MISIWNTICHLMLSLVHNTDSFIKALTMNTEYISYVSMTASTATKILQIVPLTIITKNSHDSMSYLKVLLNTPFEDLDNTSLLKLWN